MNTDIRFYEGVNSLPGGVGLSSSWSVQTVMAALCPAGLEGLRESRQKKTIWTQMAPVGFTGKTLFFCIWTLLQ